MGLPQKPKALFTANGWYLDLPGLVSPHFETLSGLSKRTGTVQTVDAGTNVVYKFRSQIIDFGTIGLTRTLNGSADDRLMDRLVDLSLTSGQKFSGQLIKRHFGNIVFTIGLDGLGFTEDVWPDFNIEGEEKLVKTYTATVDTWLVI